MGYLPKIRLSDIAQATGYSINTVSRALKGRPDIALATRNKIQAKAREMGYITDAVASSLRSGRSRTIAVVLGDIANPYFGLWVKEIEERAFAAGYSTLIMNTNEDESVEQAAIRTALSKRVDGLIVCLAQKTRASLDLLRSCGSPYVLAGRSFPDDDSPCVMPDDVRSGFLATKYLLEQGCRRILMLNGPDWISSARDRLAGHRQALAAAGLPFRADYIRTAGVQSGQTRALIQQALAARLDFDGLLAFSDLMALEAMASLGEHRLAWPKLPLASFDDISSRLFLPLRLASVRTRRPLAECAFQMLQELMEKKEPAWKRLVLEVELVGIK